MRWRFLKLGLMVVTCTFITSCLVGPNFHKPAPPHTATYTESPQPTKTVKTPGKKSYNQKQYLEMGRDIPADWWAMFHSEALNQLIQQGLANSPNLISAKAAIIQAQENYNAQLGTAFFPAVNAQLTGVRQGVNKVAFADAPGASIFNLFNATVAVSYTLDIFGGARRGLEALYAEVDYERYLLAAAYLTMTSNIATTAITEASLRAQIQATQQIIREQEQELKIVKSQFELGGASGSDVYSQESQLAQTRATLPPLLQQLAATHHTLSILVGNLPSDDHLPQFDLDKLKLPTHLPVSCPASLVKQRPDILASEALLHAASAQIGVATANLFPQITLNASYGWEDNVVNQLFKPSTKVWSYGGGVLAPIFNGGALQARKRAAMAAYDQAFAQYKQTVLQAFKNVADTLRALENDAKLLRIETEGEKAARLSFKIARDQYKLGGVSYLTLLTAERQYQQARISRIQAAAARLTDTAALFQALGGGWWNV